MRIRDAFRAGGFRLALSLLVPVRMTSTHGVVGTVTRSNANGPEATVALDRRERATWWQHRDRIFRHRQLVLR